MEPSPQGYQWRVTDAILATTASSPLFDPLTIEYQGLAYPFQDSSQTGYSNPTQLALQELSALGPGQQPSTVLSVGAGLPNIIDVDQVILPDNSEMSFKRVQEVATDTQAVHRNVWDALKK